MEFAKAGYSVVINARNEEELKQAAEDISKSVKDGGKVVSIPGDISQEVCHECFYYENLAKPNVVLRLKHSMFQK
jgi:short-subunit dehydrogenase